MAPIGDDTVQTLQELVQKLESRVKQLEDKLEHASTGIKHTATEGVRMILMGPPGAGMYTSTAWQFAANILELRLICSLQARELKHQRSRISFLAVIWYVITDFSWDIWTYADALKGYRRYASIASRKEDTFRSGSQEDYGSGRPCQ